MTELRDDLDRALRTLPAGEAPVERAMREGRRLRVRRRLAALAGALAIAAAAAVTPSLARGGAAPALPAANHPATPMPSPSRDPVVTDQPPAPGAASGTIAQGAVGGVKWTVVLSTSTQPVKETCYTASTGLNASGPVSAPSEQLTQDCAATADGLVVVPGSDPAALIGGICDVGAAGPEQVMFGAAATDVAYFTLTFSDGQQLKLIPVAWQGRRYVAWVAPASMTITGLTAHLGGPNTDSGQTATAVPFEPAGQPPYFGLWLKPGQAVPPRARGVIGHGTAGGSAWSASAYEGPWGTCFVPGPDAILCVPLDLAATTVLGVGGDQPGPVYGSAAPGVARLRITLSNGKSVEVSPVRVGNERLFAFWPGAGVSTTGWTAYNAAGRVAGTASMASPSSSRSATPG